MDNNNQTLLTKYNKKTFLLSGVFGVLLGLGIIVPGISGGAIAIIFGLYAQLLYSFGNIFKDFKRCFNFLLPILIGMVLGLLIGFFTIKKLMEILPFSIIGLFGGLMCGAFPAITNEIKGEKLKPTNICLIIVGFITPLLISVISIFGSNLNSYLNITLLSNPSWTFILICIPIGFLVGLTQILPGLSATAVLMVLGLFKILLDSVSLTFWLNNPIVFLVYFALGVGFLLGIVLFSKLVSNLLSKYKLTLFSLIIGLSIGSIISIFFNLDTYQIYLTWYFNGIVLLDLILSILLFIVGFISSYLLVLKEIKHK